MCENWTKTSNELSPEGVTVFTKIDDDQGCRNVQPLQRRGRLWFTSDGKMYVYYTPTHWRPMTDEERLNLIASLEDMVTGEVSEYKRVMTELKSQGN